MISDFRITVLAVDPCLNMRISLQSHVHEWAK